MEQQLTLLDGGMGRELMRIGAPFRQPEWSALALTEGPEWVVRAHTNFIEAGAEIVTTNSYAIVPFHIGDERFAAEGRHLASTAGRLARQAATATERAIRVAGSLPPLFGSYQPDLFRPADVARIIDPLVDGLGEHVDIWLGETLGSIVEAEAVAHALERAGGLGGRPLWISYTLDDDRPGSIRSGEAVADAVRAAIGIGATAVLFNCCQAETISVAIDVAVERVTDEQGGDTIAIGGYANRFATSHDEPAAANDHLSAFRDDLDPVRYGEFVATWIERGATLVGGCCGMGPDHIAALATLVGRS